MVWFLVIGGIIVGIVWLTAQEINVVRGLFRFWIVCSVLWVALWLVLAHQSAERVPDSVLMAKFNVPLNTPSWAVPDNAKSPDRDKEFRMFAIVGLIPPAFVLLVGWAVVWDLRGAVED